MKQAVVSALAMVVGGFAVANAAPLAEEAVVNLVAGQCLSEIMGTALPAGSLDPRTAGATLTARDRDPRLSKQALRIPTASGAVYYDHSGDYCNVHAAGIDNARTVTALEAALDRLRLKTEKHKVRFVDRKEPDDPSVMRTSVMIIIVTPADNPTMPMVMITYAPAYADIVTIGVVMGSKK